MGFYGWAILGEISENLIPVMLPIEVLGHFLRCYIPDGARVKSVSSRSMVFLGKCPPEDRKLPDSDFRAIYVLFIRTWAVHYRHPDEHHPTYPTKVTGLAMVDRMSQG